MFACVVVFGLFHGLFVLPAVLSLIGPTFKQEDEERIVHSKSKNMNTRL